MAPLIRARQRVDVARNALAALAEYVPIPAGHVMQRDAAIQRFEFTVEAIWKAAQAVLDAREGLVAASPKAVVRGCEAVGWLDRPSADALFDAIDDRNMTSHTYQREIAELLAEKLPSHLAALSHWLQRLGEAVA